MEAKSAAAAVRFARSAAELPCHHEYHNPLRSACDLRAAGFIRPALEHGLQPCRCASGGEAGTGVGGPPVPRTVRRVVLRGNVVVAGGSVVLLGDAHDIDGERAEVVHPAAHALPVAAAGASRAADGLVVGDAAVADGGARPGLDGQPAPESVAAVAAAAAAAA